MEEVCDISTGSAAVSEQAYTWLKVCCETHETCKKLGSSKGYSPTRLIDVGAKGQDNWKLCLRSDRDLESPDYLTLSYRWARDPTVLLLGSTVDTFRHGAPIANLPKTFRDAIEVARSMAVKYIWIDSLCIIQDSPEDWAQESILMHDVYAGSACTIAASASEDPEGGLFRPRKATDVQLGFIKIDLPTLGTKYFRVWDQFYMNRLTHGPLTNRGWVFQERVLSPRVLHFSQYQIAWECFAMSKCETFPNWSPYPAEAEYLLGPKTLHGFLDRTLVTGFRPPKKTDEDKTMSGGVYDQWMHFVQAYSRCAFTCPQDRLIAMEGIAKLFEKHTGDVYLAGLWRSRIIEGLNWVVVNPLARPRQRFRAPSWSWAAVDSIVFPQKVNLPRDDDLIEVISATAADCLTPAGWREVHGRIVLRCCLTAATVLDDFKQTKCTTDAASTPITLLDFPSKLYVLPDTLDMTFTAGEKLHLLPLRTTLRRQVSETGSESEELFGTTVVILEGMILELVPDKDKVYRRIGRFVLDEVSHVEFLGLRAFPPCPGATADKVVVNEARTSIVNLV